MPSSVQRIEASAAATGCDGGGSSHAEAGALREGALNELDEVDPDDPDRKNAEAGHRDPERRPAPAG